MDTAYTFRNAAGVLLVLAGLCTAPSGRAGERTSINETRALAASGKLAINNMAGSIVVRGWDRNEVAITGTLGADVEKLDISGDANNLSVVVRYPSRVHGNVDDTELELRVPARTQLAIDAVSADVRVSDTSGNIDARSVSGDVLLTVGSGEIKASTVSGDLTVRAPAYKTSLNSVSGDLSASGVRGSLDADTVSGDLSLDGGSFSAVKLQSVSGDLNLKLGLDDGGTLSAETLSGDIGLHLPKMPDAKLTMKTFSGDLHNGFAPQQDDDAHSLSATLGSGKGQIALHSFSGDIQIGSDSR
ncbi:DUF4097 family beta strand repeat-containing protein [Solimonas terrae]|uniref:DUF4097 domain-containing protein n=1 Tax=Solimonas terrae TaxID=1396819 RepID=A0A6M2BX96_9GAMM|nr:DUF4097 family beta strand repeat-containing protein [Solimonas terrae]NGY06763.1 DUF4097 domain-containing protein [Solimonas terrae]